jgi:hypothetical protein
MHSACDRGTVIEFARLKNERDIGSNHRAATNSPRVFNNVSGVSDRIRDSHPIGYASAQIRSVTIRLKFRLRPETAQEK